MAETTSLWSSEPPSPGLLDGEIQATSLTYLASRASEQVNRRRRTSEALYDNKRYANLALDRILSGKLNFVHVSGAMLRAGIEHASRYIYLCENPGDAFSKCDATNPFRCVLELFTADGTFYCEVIRDPDDRAFTVFVSDDELVLREVFLGDNKPAAVFRESCSPTDTARRIYAKPILERLVLEGQERPLMVWRNHARWTTSSRDEVLLRHLQVKHAEEFPYEPASKTQIWSGFTRERLMEFVTSPLDPPTEPGERELEAIESLWAVMRL